MESNRRYGLFTAVAIITGVVIGSGIFFKSDNILALTGGSVLLGAAVFCLAAVSIIFGSLSIARLAALSDKDGGVISYAEEWYGMGTACVFGWFHTFLYYPSLIAVVASAAGYYLQSLLGWAHTPESELLLALGIVGAALLLNFFSPLLGGIFQNVSTVVKLAPLLFIGVAGLVMGDPLAVLAPGTPAPPVAGAGWLGAVAPVAFSFDGWIVATSLCHEIKDSRRTLPLALAAAPLVILLAYLFYFVGICTLVGPDVILEMGDAHVGYAARLLLGPRGGRFLLSLVLISVLGTVNGLTMGMLRLPRALAARNMLPASPALARESQHTSVSPACGLTAAMACALWLALHYLTGKFAPLSHSDVSEAAIVVNYGGYILLYAAAIRATRRPLVPVLAMAGSVIILLGGAQSPLFGWYLLICLLLGVCAFLYYRAHRRQIHP